MAVEKRSRVNGKHSWRVRIRKPDGEWVTDTFRLKDDAEDFERDTLKALKDRSSVDPELGRELLSRYWERLCASAEELGDPGVTTMSKYRTVWDVHVNTSTLGTAEVAGITRADVTNLVKSVSKRSSGWQGTEVLKLVRRLLYDAMDRGAVVRNVASGIDAPRIERTRPRVLTPAEIDALVAALPARFGAFVLITAYGSLRWSEAVALRRGAIDLEARTVSVDRTLVEVRGAWIWGEPKTVESARTVHLPEMVVPPLAAHLLAFPPLRDQDDPRLDGLVFTGEKGGPIRRHSFRKAWDRACTAAGIEGARPGWLRHTGASIAYAATKDLKAVSLRLGHTTTKMADATYVQVYEDEAKALATAIDEMVRVAPVHPS